MVMQRPRVKREVLMFVASFILSPLACSLQRSEPARSHTVSLRGRTAHTGLFNQLATRNKKRFSNNPTDNSTQRWLTYSLMCLAEDESVSGWTCRMRTEKMLWLRGFNMHVGVNVQRLYLFFYKRKKQFGPTFGWSFG